MTLSLPGICRVFRLEIEPGGWRFGKQDVKFRIADNRTGENWALTLYNEQANKAMVEINRLAIEKPPLGEITLTAAERVELVAVVRSTFIKTTAASALLAKLEGTS